MLAIAAQGSLGCDAKVTTGGAPSASAQSKATASATGSAAAAPSTQVAKTTAKPAGDDMFAVNEAMLGKVAAAFDAHPDDCDALGAALGKIADDSEAQIEKLRAWEDTLLPADKKKAEPPRKPKRR